MSKQDRWHSNQTQRAWVCAELLSGRTITTKTEIREVNGWRLAAIIHALRDAYDWPIESEYRGKSKIKHYWLRPGTDPAKLRFPPSAKHLLEGGAA